MTEHMTPDEFRHYGRQVVEWIAEYMERVETYPVLSQVVPGQIRSQLPTHPPQSGEPLDRILADMDKMIMPGVTHWQSPNFFAFFPANVSGPSILGELLSAGLGVQGMLWATSPACTELESHVLDWMAQMLDLPAQFTSNSRGGGVIQDSASSATLCALLAAREQASAKRNTLRNEQVPLVAYTSTHAHSSVEKAMMIAGMGRENLRLVEVNEEHAMRPELLASMISKDRNAGHVPIFVCATLGTTSTLAMDPIATIGQICRTEDVWLHVDAAMAGVAAICPEYRNWQKGLEYASSYCTNAHKWLFTNFDCDCFFVADRYALISALSILPEYLRNQATESGDVIDYRDWQVPLGRRFRALKLWFVLRYYGVEGLRTHIRRHVALAQEFASWVEADERFEVAAPVHLNLVCFRHRGGNTTNQRLLDRINQSGRQYLTHTRIRNKLTLRMSIGQTHTKATHVEQAWENISNIASELESGHI